MPEVDVITNREMTQEDERVISAIEDLRENVKSFKIQHFELGYSEDDNTPAIRVSIEIRFPNRVAFKAPSFSPSDTSEGIAYQFEDLLKDNGRLRDKLPTKRRAGSVSIGNALRAAPSSFRA